MNKIELVKPISDADIIRLGDRNTELLSEPEKTKYFHLKRRQVLENKNLQEKQLLQEG